MGDLSDTEGIGLDGFHRTMSYKRVLFLLRCLRLYNITDRASGKEIDKLDRIREFFEIFVNKYQSCYALGEYIYIYIYK